MFLYVQATSNSFGPAVMVLSSAFVNQGFKNNKVTYGHYNF